MYPVGRNGMHRYNNQDHSMFTAMLSVENIFGAHHDIWSVNVEAEYHEERARRASCVTFEPPQPVTPTADECELLLGYLELQRRLVVQTTNGLTEEQARWTPDGKLTPIIGLVNHLTCVEWRWIDGGLLRRVVSRSEEEFTVGMDRTLQEVVDAYRARAEATNTAVRGAPGLDTPCVHSSLQGIDLRYVLIHLIEETAHHAGHAKSTRDMLDGWRSDW